MAKCINNELNREYLELIKADPNDAEHRREAWDYMEHSTAVFAGITVFSSYVPKIFDAASHARLESIAEKMYSILEKVMHEYETNPEYRKLFRFDSRLEELMLVPRGYKAYLPFGRIDLFLNEETLEATFCEFNADGSSGMNENREVLNSVRPSLPFQEFCKRHNVRDDTKNLFSGWVDEFLSIYKTYDKAVSAPHVAIVDYLENAVVEEFKVYAKLFEERGVSFSVYDVRDLTYENGKLIGHKPVIGKDGAAIDAIWRRTVASDVIEHWDESQPFINAVKDQNVCLIGSFLGHVVHDKQIFQVLYHGKTKAFLTEDENAFIEETIPFTSFLDKDSVDIEKIKADPEKWIIKPTDLYGSKDTFAGRDYSKEEWAEVIDSHIGLAGGRAFLVQRYCVPYKTPAIPFYNKEENYTDPPREYYNISGLYLENGKLSGVFSRLGPGSVILGRYGGVTAGSIWVDC